MVGGSFDWRISRLIGNLSEGSSRKEYKGGLVCVTEPKGKIDSSKMTYREIRMRREDKSRHQKPRCWDGLPKKTQGVLRGANLCGVVS